MLADYTTLTNSWSAFSLTLTTHSEVGIGNLWAGEEIELQGAKDLFPEAGRGSAGLPRAWDSGGEATFTNSQVQSPGQPPSAEEVSSYLKSTGPSQAP